jgi:hypothetical protein
MSIFRDTSIPIRRHLLGNNDLIGFKLQNYSLVRRNRQDRQRYFQLVKSRVYFPVAFTKYLYCLLLQSSHSPDTGLGLCLMIHLRTLI